MGKTTEAIVHTKLGDLITETSTDSNYPGIYISLKRGNTICQIALVEVEQGDWGNWKLGPALQAHIWSPEDQWGDPIDSHRWVKDEVDAMFDNNDEE